MIKSRRRRDSIIIGVLIGFCTIVILTYLWRWWCGIFLTGKRNQSNPITSCQPTQGDWIFEFIGSLWYQRTLAGAGAHSQPVLYDVEPLITFINSIFITRTLLDHIYFSRLLTLWIIFISTFTSQNIKLWILFLSTLTNLWGFDAAVWNPFSVTSIVYVPLEWTVDYQASTGVSLLMVAVNRALWSASEQVVPANED